jgi:hypothetical protein
MFSVMILFASLRFDVTAKYQMWLVQVSNHTYKKGKGKAIPVTGRGSP